MLCIYSIPIINDSSIINYQPEILDDLLPFIIPWKFFSDIIEDDNWGNKMLYYFTLGDTSKCETAQYVLPQIPQKYYTVLKHK